MTLKITNNNSFDYQDRYDGQDYTFPAGETVLCPEDAARHIFGLGEEDKTRALARSGWIKTTGDLAEGMKKLNNFKFVPFEIAHSERFATQAQGPAPLGTEDAVEATDGAEAADSTTIPQKRGRAPRAVEAPKYTPTGKRSIANRLAPAA